MDIDIVSKSWNKCTLHCASSVDLLDGGQHWSLLLMQRKPQLHRNGTHLNMQQGSSPDTYSAAQELERAHGSHSFVHPLTHTGISQSTDGLENKATVGIERTPQQHEKNAQQDNDRQGQTLSIPLKLLNSTHAKKTISVPLLTHLLCSLRLLHNWQCVF